MTPQISVVIPVYNGSKYIAQAIESVLNQEYPAHQIIVVDDGSTDDTPEVLKRFEGKIIHKRIKNSGPSVARNIGMDLVTGDWIGFLDADDLWFRNKLKKQAEMIQKYPEVGFVCCNYAVRYDFLKFRMTEHFSILKNRKEMNFDAPLLRDPFELMIKENFVGTPSTFLIKKSVNDAIGNYRSDYRNSQDFDYQLRAALATPFLVISEMLLYKRAHKGNISNDKFKHYLAHRDILYDILASNRRLVDERKLLPVFRRSIAETSYHYGNAYFEAGKRRSAFEVYWEALEADPSAENAIRFLWMVLKKGVRVLTGDAVKRK